MSESNYHNNPWRSAKLRKSATKKGKDNISNYPYNRQNSSKKCSQNAVDTDDNNPPQEEEGCNSKLLELVTQVNSTDKSSYAKYQSPSIGIRAGQCLVPRSEGFLGPQSPNHLGRKTLVLDLDETLVHSSFQPLDRPDIILPVEIEGKIFEVFVLKRPFVEEFLRYLAPHFEIVIYTASLSKYADPLLDALDPHGYSVHRLFREHCTFHGASFVKDLSKLGRNLKDVIIVDNSPTSYAFHPENAIPSNTWLDDMQDDELRHMGPLLIQIAKFADVRYIIRKLVSNDEVDYSSAFNLIKTELDKQKCKKRESGKVVMNAWTKKQEGSTTTMNIGNSSEYKSSNPQDEDQRAIEEPKIKSLSTRGYPSEIGCNPGDICKEEGSWKSKGLMHANLKTTKSLHPQSTRGEKEISFKFRYSQENEDTEEAVEREGRQDPNRPHFGGTSGGLYTHGAPVKACHQTQECERVPRNTRSVVGAHRGAFTPKECTTEEDPRSILSGRRSLVISSPSSTLKTPSTPKVNSRKGGKRVRKTGLSTPGGYSVKDMVGGGRVYNSGNCTPKQPQGVREGADLSGQKVPVPTLSSRFAGGYSNLFKLKASLNFEGDKRKGSIGTTGNTGTTGNCKPGALHMGKFKLGGAAHGHGHGGGHLQEECRNSIEKAQYFLGKQRKCSTGEDTQQNIVSLNSPKATMPENPRNKFDQSTWLYHYERLREELNFNSPKSMILRESTDKGNLPLPSTQGNSNSSKCNNNSKNKSNTHQKRCKAAPAPEQGKSREEQNKQGSCIDLGQQSLDRVRGNPLIGGKGLGGSLHNNRPSSAKVATTGNGSTNPHRYSVAHNNQYIGGNVNILGGLHHNQNKQEIGNPGFERHFGHFGKPFKHSIGLGYKGTNTLEKRPLITNNNLGL